MNNKNLTTIEIKKINKNNIYQYIYFKKQCSKQNITTDLNIGLTSLNQNLKALEKENLIQKGGFYESTGGRKAYALEINKNARISIGIEILKNKLYIISINLYGEVLHTKVINEKFVSSIHYCKKIGQYLQEFIYDYSIKENTLLGVTITLQGIISKNGNTISYSPLLDNTDLTLDDFQKYIPYPCCFEHDSKAAAYLECWHKKEFSDAFVLLLNDNLGSAVVTNQKVHYGKQMHSGIIEHMTISLNGETCYCGKKGCLETYCSAQALLKGEKASEFFKKVRLNEDGGKWKEYLNVLSFAISNIHTIFDVPIIISGYLASYIIDDDLKYILYRIHQQYAFSFDEDYLHLSDYGRLAPAIGGALIYIDQFIAQV